MFDLFLGVFILNSTVERHILTVLLLSEFTANDNVNVVNFHSCYCLPMDKGVAFKADFFFTLLQIPQPPHPSVMQLLAPPPLLDPLL